MFKISNLSVRYTYVNAVSDLSLEIAPGEMVAMLGGNGAGKTTTLRTISGLMKPVSGSIEYEGQNLVGLSPHEIVSRGIIQVPEGRRIFPDLSVRENLIVGAFQTKGDLSADFDRVFELFPKLKERLTQRGQTLSGGEQQMLAIGRAMMGRPKLLMFDEPSLGLAPIIVDRLFDQIKVLKSATTILLVEQNAQLALELADRAYVLQQGHIVRQGAGAEILKSDWLREAYLGPSTST